MRTLFVKHTYQRHEAYRIITLIEEQEDGRIRVRKRPQTSAAEGHVQAIFDNYRRIESMDSPLKAPKVFMENGQLVSEYIEGVSFEQTISEAIQRGVQADVIAAFEDYYQFIKALPSVKQNPSSDSKFATFFSNCDAEFDCLQVGLIDLIPENIIIDSRDKQHYHIDCEWLIDAPIPVDFVMFRAIVVIYHKYHRTLPGLLDLRSVLAHFSLIPHQDLFNTWESEFSERIHESCDIYKNNYQVNSPSLSQWKDKKPHVLNSSMFYSGDGNFREDKRVSRDLYLKNTFAEGRFSLETPTSVSHLRWDPCEDYCVLVRDIHLEYLSGEDLIEASPRMTTNAIEVDQGVYLFLSNDPQFLFAFSEPLILDCVRIRAAIQVLSYSDIMYSGDYLKTWRFGLAASLKDLQKDTFRLRQSIENNQRILKQYVELIVGKAVRISTLENNERSLKAIANNYMHEYQRKNEQIRLITRSPLYRIFEPLRFIKRQIFSIIRPLGAMRTIELIPMSGVLAEAPGVFLSENEDPQLLLIRKAKKGLYYFRWNGKASRATLLQIYPVVQGETTELDAIRLGSLETEAEQKERFVYLRHNADFLRLDLGDKSGVESAINDIKYTRLGAFASVRVGLAIISQSTGYKKWRLFMHFVKLILTGRKNEAKQQFVETFYSFGDGINLKMSAEEAYANYIHLHEQSEAEVKAQRIVSRDLSHRPLISVFAPINIYDSNLIREMIQSVLAQSYPKWELCIVGAQDMPENLQSLIEDFADLESRIRMDFTMPTASYSGLLNRALAMAEGEFVISLRTFDLLAPWALFELASHINDVPTADFVYTDEDRMGLDGQTRSHPKFKPQWSPDFLLSNNYIGNAYLARTDRMRDVGGFRDIFETDCQYDMILRLTETTENIFHIPSVIYHSRFEQLFIDMRDKIWLEDASVRMLVIRDHLERIGRKGDVQYDDKRGVFDIDYAIQGEPLISLVIPNYEHIADLQKCIDSILHLTTYRHYEIVIIENNSTSMELFAYYEHLKKDNRVRVIKWSNPFNYSAINNFGVAHAQGEYIVLLNNDTEVIAPDWLQKMLGFAQRDDVGAVGARLLYSDQTIQHAGVIIGFCGVAGHAFAHMPSTEVGYMNRAVAAQNVSAVTAACLMMKKSLFEKINGFEEQLAVAFNDIDLCLKIREQGYRIVYAPKAELYHHESLSRGADDTDEKRSRFASEVKYFKKRWHRVLKEGDPYYSPHLDLVHETFRISGE